MLKCSSTCLLHSLKEALHTIGIGFLKRLLSIKPLSSIAFEESILKECCTPDVKKDVSIHMPQYFRSYTPFVACHKEYI